MLTQWNLSNFKSICDAKIPLAPLTVLTGTNSSGKSSLIQSMLLVAQTLQTHVPESRLVLNGPLIKLGSFEQILSCKNKKSDDTLNFQIHLEPEKNKINFICWKIHFERSANNFEPAIKFIANTTKIQSNGENEDIIEFEVNNKDGKLYASNFSDYFLEYYYNLLLKVPKKLIFDPVAEKHFQENFDFNILYNLLNEVFSDENTSKFKDAFKKNFINCMIDTQKEIHFQLLLEKTNMQISRKTILEVEPYHFMINKFIPPLDKLMAAAKITKKEDWDELLIIEPVSMGVRLFSEHFINSFKYLGPLRYRKNISPFLETSNPRDVGTDGRYAAAVYDLCREKQIEYISYTHFENIEYCRKEDFSVNEGIFSEVLNEWIRYLGIAEKIDVKQTEDGYKIQVTHKVSDKEFNLTHVGTGVSQVFPILVMCLIAEKGSTLVFEQEELHLHPAVQSRLADFFLSMAFLEKQCIIETHSEYFITQLRYRISKALVNNDKTINEKTKIYFVDKNGMESNFREIKVTKYGGISE